jgi:NAD(P)-dependent dehydrogenase (short-subunit alcohol dehydrogenase family)
MDTTISPFGFASTAEEVVAGLDLSGKRAIVTGAASGIGVETARALARAGADVTIAVRRVDAGERVAGEIGGAVDVRALDLSDQQSVRRFAEAWDGPLHILINNAGVMALPSLQRTSEGWEMQLATNHLGHFALAVLLHPALAAAEGARVISLSSVAHRRDGLDFDDLNFERREYDPMVAYAQSKTATALFAVGASAHWADDGILANAVHPGAIADSNLSRHMAPEALKQARTSGGYRFKTPEQGAATSVFVATSPLLEGVGGRYFDDVAQAPVIDPATAAWGEPGVAAHALDPDRAERLWEISARLVGRGSAVD